MRCRPVRLFLVIAATLQLNLALSQATRPPSQAAAVPQIGALVPDLEIVDDQGNLVRLRELTEGHYTVMTLGCLT